MNLRARLHARSSRTQKPAKSLWERDSQRWYAARYAPRLALEAASKFAPGSQPPLRANRRTHADLSRQSRKTPGWRPGVTVIKNHGWRLEVSTVVSTITSGFFWKPADRTAYCSSGRSERSPPLGKHPMNECNSRDLGWWTQHSVVLLPRLRAAVYFDHALTECETGMRRNPRSAGVRGLFRLGHVKVGRLIVSHP